MPLHRLSLLAVSALLLSSCQLFLIGDRFDFWQHEGPRYIIEDVPANQERGTIARIVLYWVPPGSKDMRKDEKSIWEVTANQPVAFAGFSFRVFETPAHFRVSKAPRPDLPRDGTYYLEIYGQQPGDLLMEDLPSTDDILAWRKTLRDKSE